MKPAPGSKQPQKPVEAPAPAPEPAVNSDLVRPAPTPEMNPRNRAAAEIAKRANADADIAAQESLPEGDGEHVAEAAAPAEQQPTETAPEAATEPQEAPAAAAEAAAPAAVQAAPSASGIDPVAEYEIVVDGKPVKLKGSQILSRVQKGEAADARLELASKLLEEAKRTVQPQQPPAQGVAAQQPIASQPAHMDEAQIAQLIQLGSPEQAAEAIRALRAQRPDVVTQEGLQQFMGQHLAKAMDMQFMFREGKAFAEREYGDLLADPHLKRLWFSIEDEKRKAGDARPHVELYKEIGEELRKHFNRPATPKSAAPTQTATAPSLAAKQAAKAAAPAAPKLASARLEGGAEAQRPKTREEIIQQMRAARGQDRLTVK